MTNPNLCFGYRITFKTLQINLLCIIGLVCFEVVESVAMDQSDVISAVVRCVNFAAIKHKDQRRKDREKTPYINHPIGT